MKPSSTNIRQKAMNKARPDRFMRNEETVASSNPARVPNPGRVRQNLPSKAFSNLFNAYTQAFNKRFNRHGSLFEKPFRRTQITHEKYFKNDILSKTNLYDLI
jgi:hypothetical protein